MDICFVILLLLMQKVEGEEDHMGAEMVVAVSTAMYHPDGTSSLNTEALIAPSAGNIGDRQPGAECFPRY